MIHLDYLGDNEAPRPLDGGVGTQPTASVDMLRASIQSGGAGGFALKPRLQITSSSLIERNCLPSKKPVAFCFVPLHDLCTR